MSKKRNPYEEAIRKQEKIMSEQECMEKEFGRKPKKGYHFVRSIMGGKVVELKDGTPRCCDPSSELYWSM